MGKYAEQLFLAEEIARRLQGKTVTAMPIGSTTLNAFGSAVPMQPPSDTAMLAWLQSGPDDQIGLDDTISTGKTVYNYAPEFVIWALSVTNNAASGGPNILIKFARGKGTFNTYKVPPTKTVGLNEIKGGFGSRFTLETDSGSAEIIGFVSLKRPLARPVTSATLEAALQ